MKTRVITKQTEDVTIRRCVLPEDFGVRGNLQISGDDEADTAAEDEVLDRLDRGEVVAWCVLQVNVRFMGLESVVYLGGCSYSSEDDAWAHNYSSLCDEALVALNEQVHELAEFLR